MHIIFVVVGAVVGLWLGYGGEEVLGMMIGALVASLLFRLNAYRAQLDRLGKRVDNLEQRQASAIPIKPKKLQSEPPVSLYEPEPIKTPPLPEPALPPTAEPEPIVHARVPEIAPEPGPLSHTLEVIKRWLTTGNVPVKVGVIISFFGVAFLLKYAVENSSLEIPISVRYLGVAAFATVLLVLGWRMRSKQPVYALSLQGGGIGVLFLTVFAAFQIHDLLPPTMAFGILVIVTVAAGMLAVVQESRALAILGTTGGFLAPLMVSTGTGDHVALFSYYLILNCAVLGVAWLRAWRELNIIGFGFTFGVGTLWGYEYYVPELFASTEPFLVAHFLFYTAIAILFAFKAQPKLRGYVDGTLVFGTPTIAFALQTQLLDGSKYGLAISAAVAAVFYAALALWLRRTQERNFDLLAWSFVALSVGFATIAIPLAVDDRWTAIAWALEGTALIWIGVRQDGTLARLSGAALGVAAGVAFLRHGWVENPETPVLNGNYLGGTLIALCSIASARLLGADARALSWQRLVSTGLLIWGLLWWFCIGLVEISEAVSPRIEWHLLLLFYSGSFAVMAFAGRYYQWAELRHATMLFLPLLLPAFIFYSMEHGHIFEGYGLLAWLGAIVAHVWILNAYGGAQSRAAAVSHGWGAVFFVALLSHEVSWQVRQLVNTDTGQRFEVPSYAWSNSTSLLVLAAGAAALLFLRDKVQWPIKTYLSSYFVAALVLVVGGLLMTVSVSIGSPGDPSPMSYIPLLNPFDILALGGLAAAWYVVHVAQTVPKWNRANIGNAPIWLWSAAAFLLATLAVVRGVHHLSDVPWDRSMLMSSVVVQTSLTIFWAALGVAGMLLGTKRSSRSIYVAGGVLMLVVILKLWVIDFQNNETVFGIASFLGVGLMLLIVGYFSPIPPKSDEATP